MKNIFYLFTTAMILTAVISACNNSKDNSPKDLEKKESNETPKPEASLREKVMSADDQKAMTPDMVIQNLKEGNQRYMSNKLTANDYIGMMHSSTHGQYPEAFILSCIDSRVPVEEIFDKTIGDLFVGRVAGNIVDEDELGSMEYGCKISGAKLIVVLGHESCGAVKGALENEKLGNVTALLARIKPAMEKSKDFAGEKNVENPAYVEYVVKNNVKNSIENIQLKSPVLKEMVNKGEIKIVGAYYNFATGEVSFLQ